MLRTPTQTKVDAKKETVSAKSTSRPSELFVHPMVLRVVIIAVIGSLGIAGCIKFITNISTSKPTVTQIGITNSRFSQSTLDITEGSTVRFKNATQNVYWICIGQNAHCMSHGDGPKALYNLGIIVSRNQTVNATFNAQGTYPITAVFMPELNLVVNVGKTQGGDSSGTNDNSTNSSDDNGTIPSNINSSSNQQNVNGTNSDDDGSNVSSPSNSDGSNDSNASSTSSSDNGGSSGGDDGGDSGGGGGGGDD